MEIFPRASKSCSKIGWTLEFEFTEKIANSVNALDSDGCPVAMEDAENIMLASEPFLIGRFRDLEKEIDRIKQLSRDALRLARNGRYCAEDISDVCNAFDALEVAITNPNAQITGPEAPVY